MITLTKHNVNFDNAYKNHNIGTIDNDDDGYEFDSLEINYNDDNYDTSGSNVNHDRKKVILPIVLRITVILKMMMIISKR